MNENCRTVSQRMVSDTICLNADKTHRMLGETGQKLLASIKRLTAMRRSGLDRLAMLSFIKTFYHTLSQLKYYVKQVLFVSFGSSVVYLLSLTLHNNRKRLIWKNTSHLDF